MSIVIPLHLDNFSHRLISCAQAKVWRDLNLLFSKKRLHKGCAF